QVVAVAPSGIVTGPIEVDVQGVPSGVGTQAVQTATNFVVPAPTISGFAPSSGYVGTAITISGSNFDPNATSVLFGSVVAALISTTTTQVTAVVPAGVVSGPVTIVTPAGSATSAGAFSIAHPSGSGPVVTGISPTSGPSGTLVTITGSNFSATG